MNLLFLILLLLVPEPSPKPMTPEHVAQKIATFHYGESDYVIFDDCPCVLDGEVISALDFINKGPEITKLDADKVHMKITKLVGKSKK